MRFFLNLSFDGGPFSGWQRQKNAPSVQEALERALSIVLGEDIEVTGAGRTDAGVNAAGYKAHFDAPPQKVLEKPERNLHKINAILPREITVHSFLKVPAGAHARFDASSRTYKYFIHTVKDPFAHHSWYYTLPTDADVMNRAAALLCGTRDFSSFEKKGSDNRTSICTVKEARWESLPGGRLIFTVTADRFLRNMVRAMVGTLLEVGRGRIGADSIPDLLEAADRGRAGQSVPGEALFLTNVEYPFELIEI